MQNNNLNKKEQTILSAFLFCVLNCFVVVKIKWHCFLTIDKVEGVIFNKVI